MAESKNFAPYGAIAGLAVAAWFIAPKYFVYGSPDMEVDAATVSVELMQNSATAFARYDGKLIELTGPLRTTRMFGSTPIVVVGPPLFNVDCHLPSSAAEQAGALRALGAKPVRVIGRANVAGSSMHLKPCKLA